MEVLLAGRLLQGLGGGGLMALAFVAVSALFPRSQMPLVLAAVSALWGVSAFLGPLVGGVFAEAGLWRGGFWFFAAQAGAARRRHRRRAPPRAPTCRAAPAACRCGAWRCSRSPSSRSPPAGSGRRRSSRRRWSPPGSALFVAFLRADDRREADRLLPRRALDPRDRSGPGC